MIDPRQPPARDGASVIEQSLRRLLEEGRPPRRFLLAEGFRFHGVGQMAGSDPDLAPPLASFAGLLEGGRRR